MDVIEVVELTVERLRLTQYERRESNNPLKSATSRLCAYPALKYRVDHLRGYMERVRAYSDIELMRSRSWVSRMTPAQVRAALIKDIDADLARTEAEIALLEKTVEGIRNGDIARLRYFEDKPDEEVMALLGYSRATLQRKRTAAQQAAAVFFYGEAAGG